MKLLVCMFKFLEYFNMFFFVYKNLYNVKKFCEGNHNKHDAQMFDLFQRSVVKDDKRLSHESLIMRKSMNNVL